MTHQWSVKLKNYNVALKRFGLFLTFALLLGCASQKPQVTAVSGKLIPVTDAHGEASQIAAFIKPYHDHIDAEMNKVLAVAPQTFDKSGQWQTSIGCLFADVTRAKADSLFFRREKMHVDFAMLNSGGVRSIIPKGNVTVRTAYEIMPFENSVIVAEMHDAQIREMLAYIIAEKKPHPLSGIVFTIGKDGVAQNILIGGQPYDPAKTYYVATNDYLYLGGDNMVFFAKSGKSWPLDYKLRNVLIDYFKEVDMLPVPTDVRIHTE